MNRVFTIAMTAVLSCALGCGGDGAEGGSDVFPVTGTVTMQGGALANATVVFAPTAPGQPTAMGKTDAEGKFSMTTYDPNDGTAEGKFKVVISKTVYEANAQSSVLDADGHSADENAGSHGAAAGADLVPGQYAQSASTPLTADVSSSGENVFTFEIK